MKNAPYFPHGTSLFVDIYFSGSLSAGWLFYLPAEKQYSEFAANLLL